jgi:para-nitrobenzyl esterase
MMRTLLFASALLIAFNLSEHATAQCGTSRYDQEVFSNVNITSNVPYGSSVDYTGVTNTLTMDIYQPDGDTAISRPLIVWAHGGSFMGGTKNDPDITVLCNRFAKRGYVCASINYRLGIPVPNQTNATKAVYRAVQDMKAAIRFFRQDAAGSSSFRIDPNKIYAGGSSAGGFMALHLAYLDQSSEIPSQIDTVAMGGLEGNSGNPGFSSEVNAVVNLCGALGNKTWMTAGDEPLCSMHGTADNIVPYGTAMLYLLSFVQIMVVDGSHSVNDYANQVGVPNVMYTFQGSGHVPYLSNTAYMDTTVRFVSNFLYSQLGCTPTDPNPYPNTFNTQTGINAVNAESVVNIFPQPANDRCIVRSASLIQRIEIMDLSGRQVYSASPNNSEVLVDVRALSAGTYLVKIELENQVAVKKLVIE